MLSRVKRIDPVLIAAVLAAGFLNIYGIWKDQYANAYYTAAVTSMLQNFHNFFFASFDPGGFVTVDKPPVAFWVQTLFAAVFGVHGWSVILPQALAGIGSVILIYVLVKPTFGRGAARISALVMACTPIAAAVSRTNNVDSLLVFTLLWAVWALFRAVKSGKLRWFFIAFGLIGLGFNIKMLQAYMVLPAFYVFYWLGFKAGRKRKMAVIAASTAVLLVISFSWAVIVDSIPQSARPYIGSSKTNSVLELAFGYNGLSRLTGQKRGAGVSSEGLFNHPLSRAMTSYTFSPQKSDTDYNTYGQENKRQISSDFVSGQKSGNIHNGSQDGGFGNAHGTANQTAGGKSGGFGGGGMFNTGKAGILRLCQSQLSGQISWLLPFALWAGIGLLLGMRFKQALTDRQRESLFWLAWLLPMMGFFSIAGFFHPYYLIMLAPAIAALTGAGWMELYEFYRNRTGPGWKQWLLPAGILGSTLFQLYIIWPYGRQIGFAWPIAVGVLGGIFSLYLFWTLFKSRRSARNVSAGRAVVFSRTAAIGGLLVLLVAPLYWAATPFLYGGNSMMPEAGPQLNSGNRGSFGRQTGFEGQGEHQGRSANRVPGQVQNQASDSVPAQSQGQMRETINTQLLNYLEAHNNGEKFLFATTNAGTAEAYIIRTGRPVMAMGGFSGSDPILTVDKLKQLVADKTIKYFLLSGGGPGGGRSDIQDWIKKNGKEIPPSAWQSASENKLQQGGREINGSGTLYEVSL